MATPSTFRGSTMWFGRVGSIYLVVHPEQAPSSLDWDEWLKDIEREAPSIDGVLVYTEGGGPDARQRKLTAEMWERRGYMPPVALVSGSPLVRVIVTALNYFLSNPIRAYPPSDLEAALALHLKVPRVEHTEIRRAISSALGRLQTSKQATL